MLTIFHPKQPPFASSSFEGNVVVLVVMIIKTKTSIITCRHFSVIGYFNCSWHEQLTKYVVEIVWAHNLSYPVDRHCVLYNIPGKFASRVFRQHASYSFLELKNILKRSIYVHWKKKKFSDIINGAGGLRRRVIWKHILLRFGMIMTVNSAGC